MKTLFVDCDDTLVLWLYLEKKLNDETIYVLPEDGEKFQPNTALVEKVERFLSLNPNWGLVVWSGGGMEYAAKWARYFFPDKGAWIYPKDIKIPDVNDVCIDDQELKVKARLFTWQNFTLLQNRELVDLGSKQRLLSCKPV